MSVSSINSVTPTSVPAFVSVAPSAPDQGGGGAASGTTPATPSAPDQFRSDFTALFSAVQKGDISGAQQALAAAQVDSVGLYKPLPPPSIASTTQFTGQSDFEALIDAIKSGDTDAAQAALAKLKADALTGYGHHHHHGAVTPTSTASVPPTTSPTSTSDT